MEAQLAAPYTIEPFGGARSELLPLFRLADDSASEIAAYLELGEIWVVRCEQSSVGHVQLVPVNASEHELKSLAVLEAHRGRGLGVALVERVKRAAVERGATRLLVATASADLDNLRFYQRHGFRMTHIEQDAFTAERGYPAQLEADGIPVRDRVWLALEL